MAVVVHLHHKALIKYHFNARNGHTWTFYFISCDLFAVHYNAHVYTLNYLYNSATDLFWRLENNTSWIWPKTNTLREERYNELTKEWKKDCLAHKWLVQL